MRCEGDRGQMPGERRTEPGRSRSGGVLGSGLSCVKGVERRG